METHRNSNKLCESRRLERIQGLALNKKIQKKNERLQVQSPSFQVFGHLLPEYGFIHQPLTDKIKM